MRPWGTALCALGLAACGEAEDPLYRHPDVACAPFAFDPAVLRVAARGVGQLRVSGGSERAVLFAPAEGAALRGTTVHPGGGVQAGEQATRFEVEATDGWCGARARGAVEVIAGFEVLPREATVARGASLTYTASGLVGALPVGELAGAHEEAHASEVDGLNGLEASAGGGRLEASEGALDGVADVGVGVARAGPQRGDGVGVVEVGEGHRGGGAYDRGAVSEGSAQRGGSVGAAGASEGERGLGAGAGVGRASEHLHHRGVGLDGALGLRPGGGEEEGRDESGGRADTTTHEPLH